MMRERNGTDWRSVVAIVIGLCVLLPAGCSYIEDSTGAKDKPKRRRSARPVVKTDGAGVTPEPSPTKRLIELNVDGGTRTLDACYLTLVPATSRTPTVLIVSSYKSQQEESFPSFFMRAILTDNELKNVAGTPLPAKIWLSTEPEGAVLRTPDESPASITIKNVDDDGRVVGLIINAELVNTVDSKKMTITGKFDGVL